jgi:hypothetical protein
MHYLLLDFGHCWRVFLVLNVGMSIVLFSKRLG